MPRDKVINTKKEVAREDDEFYGEETISGSQPRPSSDDNVDRIVGKTFGPDAKKALNKHKPFNIGTKVKEE